jgi:hypothetical protein
MVNRFKSLRFCFLAFGLLTLVVYSSAQDFEKIQIQTVKLTDSVYMLVGGGGNIGVSVGKDGILLVDSQFAELIEKIEAAIKKINGGPKNSLRRSFPLNQIRYQQDSISSFVINQKIPIISILH